jgi:hypothetical protein
MKKSKIFHDSLKYELSSYTNPNAIIFIIISNAKKVAKNISIYKEMYLN